MNKKSLIAIALSSVMALSVLAACGGGEEEAVTAARICYDNLGLGYIAAADSTYALADVQSMTAVDGAGNTVDASAVATYENGVFTAQSEGVIFCTLADGSAFRIEVEPAYITDPGTQYSGTATDHAQGGTLLGSCHDPSLIEVEEDGAPAYYIFSTGWATGNEIRRSTDLLTWEYMGKTMTAQTQMVEIAEWIGGTNNGYLQWWAPDIVAAPDGEYWLYTCCVSNGYQNIEGTDYSMACIALFSSDSLEAGSFEYEGVLLQSVIPNTAEGQLDVNAIDPQIIYDTEGNMYMAYGSFGTGNWMLELDPESGMRKDGVYSDNVFFDWQTIRGYRNEAAAIYSSFVSEQAVTHDYYGTMISYGAEEGPVIARHSNVKVADETATYNEAGEPEGVEGVTYYYSMHSFNPLDSGYQMWGGRSDNVWGFYRSVNNGLVQNYGSANRQNGGNKYMGSFTWADKSAGNTSTDILYPGHNDLFTTSAGVNIAAYITRTRTYGDMVFMVQLHQYYLNSMGDIVINPNRYGAEVDRSVSAEELFACTDNGRFKMVALGNDNTPKTSVEVTLTQSASDPNSGSVMQDGAEIGTWLMYGRGYIKFSFERALTGCEEFTYYGVVRPAWLDDQNRSGFTITCMGHTNRTTYSTAMFMNNVSTISGEGLVG